jgi:hypothetical protein
MFWLLVEVVVELIITEVEAVEGLLYLLNPLF